MFVHGEQSRAFCNSETEGRKKLWGGLRKEGGESRFDDKCSLAGPPVPHPAEKMQSHDKTRDEKVKNLKIGSLKGSSRSFFRSPFYFVFV